MTVYFTRILSLSSKCIPDTVITRKKVYQSCFFHNFLTLLSSVCSSRSFGCSSFFQDYSVQPRSVVFHSQSVMRNILKKNSIDDNSKEGISIRV